MAVCTVNALARAKRDRLKNQLCAGGSTIAVPRWILGHVEWNLRAAICPRRKSSAHLSGKSRRDRCVTGSFSEVDYLYRLVLRAVASPCKAQRFLACLASNALAVHTLAFYQGSICCLKSAPFRTSPSCLT